MRAAQLAQMRMAQLLQSQPPQEEMLRNSQHMIAQMIAQMIALKLRQQRQQQMALLPRWGPSPNMPNMVMQPSIDTTWRYVESTSSDCLDPNMIC
jgi:hypothetical protein